MDNVNYECKNSFVSSDGFYFQKGKVITNSDYHKLSRVDKMEFKVYCPPTTKTN